MGSVIIMCVPKKQHVVKDKCENNVCSITSEMLPVV